MQKYVAGRYWVAATAALAIVLGQTMTASAGPSSALLVDQTGRTFTLPSLRGRPLVVTFVSAHCSDACPLVNAQFSDAARKIAQQKISARLLTITLDPKADPPSVMASLARRFSANPRYWLVASGRAKDVDSILNAFGVIARQDKSGYREEHTTFVYVFDAAGNLSKTMLASTNLTQDVIDAIRATKAGTR